MKKIKYLSILVLTLLYMLSPVFAQNTRMDGPDHLGRGYHGSSLFVHNIYNYSDTKSDNSILDFNFALVNDLLTFIKSDDDKYHASYELNLVLYDKDKNPLTERSVQREVTVDYFEETNSIKSPQKINVKLSLPPGNYYYLIRLVENEFTDVLVPLTKIKLRSFTPDRLHSSDIIFLDSLAFEQNDPVFKPNINASYNNDNSEYTALIYFYPPHDAGSIKLHYEIERSNGFQFAEFDSTYQVEGLVTIPFFINFQELSTKPGRYNLRVEAESKDHKVKLQDHFTISWNQTQVQKNNIDLAIEQIKVIANRKTVNKMRDADENNKQKLYDQFWKERDPTPETPSNELKEEFMNRVNFSNENFIENYSGRGGWSTDRGQIYIKYGPPNRIERQKGDLNSPSFEIWFYSSINRAYYFADRDGNGTFRMVRVE